VVGAAGGGSGSNGNNGNGASASSATETDANSVGLPYTDPGVAVNSTNSNSGLALDGLPTAEAKAKAAAWLESKGLGRRRTNYKLRDWLFARQRYWGEPFPLVYPLDSDGNELSPTQEAVPISEDQLPLVLPDQAFRHPRVPARQRHGMAPHHRPARPLQARPPRDQHHASVGRLVLVLLAIHRPDEQWELSG